MDADKFVYWLQGFVELANTDTLSPAQWKMIKEHLALVFNKVTPTSFPPVVLPQPKMPVYQPQWTPPQPAWEPRITCSTAATTAPITTMIC